MATADLMTASLKLSRRCKQPNPNQTFKSYLRLCNWIVLPAARAFLARVFFVLTSSTHTVTLY